MRIMPPVLCLLLAFACVGEGWAQPDIDYFSSRIAVTSQSDEERARAASEAFLQVALRMSGSTAVAQNEIILEKAATALNFVEQFEYQPLATAALQQDGYSAMLSLTFAADTVKAILDQARQPFWSTQRPSTLVWLVEDHPQLGKRLINHSSNLPLTQALQMAASARGLPLVYPLLDLEDQIALSAEQLWAMDEDAISRASARYDADAMLVGRFSTTSQGELWSLWQFTHAGRVRSYDRRLHIDASPEGLMQLGVATLYPLADFLAARYANQRETRAEGALVVEVSGVENFKQYRQVLGYLDGLALVDQVQIMAVRGDILLLSLQATTRVERFLARLALDQSLQPIADRPTATGLAQQTASGSETNPLRVRWSD